MKKTYVQPRFVSVKLNITDIIATSNIGNIDSCSGVQSCDLQD